MSKPIRIRRFPSLASPTPLTNRPTLRPKTRRLTSTPLPELTQSVVPCSITSTNVALTLPLPPSINHQYATVNGRRILSSKGRQYKATVAQEIIAALATSSDRTDLLNNLNTHSLILSVWFYFSSALRRDLDGGLKIAQDAICNALDINDNRVGEIHLYRAIDALSPRMVCTLAIQQTSPLPRQKKKPAKSGNQIVLNPLAPRTRRS